MKRLDSYVTNDGKVFDSKGKALKHLDTLISNKVFYLVDMIHSKNRCNTVEYIMENLPEFQALIDLEKDKQLESEEE